MCVISMVMDHTNDEWARRLREHAERLRQEQPYQPFPQPPISQQEVDEFRRLLDRAREYDRKHNQPDCELQEKKDRLKKLADELGVAIDFL